MYDKIRELAREKGMSKDRGGLRVKQRRDLEVERVQPQGGEPEESGGLLRRNSRLFRPKITGEAGIPTEYRITFHYFLTEVMKKHLQAKISAQQHKCRENNEQRGGKEMNSYYMRIEVKDGKLKELMDRIDKAQEEIRDCYRELQDMGAVKIAPADEQPGQEINDPARK